MNPSLTLINTTPPLSHFIPRLTASNWTGSPQGSTGFAGKFCNLSARCQPKSLFFHKFFRYICFSRLIEAPKKVAERRERGGKGGGFGKKRKRREGDANHLFNRLIEGQK